MTKKFKNSVFLSMWWRLRNLKKFSAIGSGDGNFSLKIGGGGSDFADRLHLYY
jgi:hypothetical protein